MWRKPVNRHSLVSGGFGNLDPAKLPPSDPKMEFGCFYDFSVFSSGFPHKILDFAEIVKKTKKK